MTYAQAIAKIQAMPFHEFKEIFMMSFEVDDTSITMSDEDTATFNEIAELLDM